MASKQAGSAGFASTNKGFPRTVQEVRTELLRAQLSPARLVAGDDARTQHLHTLLRLSANLENDAVDRTATSDSSEEATQGLTRSLRIRGP